MGTREGVREGDALMQEPYRLCNCSACVPQISSQMGVLNLKAIFLLSVSPGPMHIVTRRALSHHMAVHIGPTKGHRVCQIPLPWWDIGLQSSRMLTRTGCSTEHPQVTQERQCPQHFSSDDPVGWLLTGEKTSKLSVW